MPAVSRVAPMALRSPRLRDQELHVEASGAVCAFLSVNIVADRVKLSQVDDLPFHFAVIRGKRGALLLDLELLLDIGVSRSLPSPLVLSVWRPQGQDRRQRLLVLD